MAKAELMESEMVQTTSCAGGIVNFFDNIKMTAYGIYLRGKIIHIFMSDYSFIHHHQINHHRQIL
jgi:hypothetical protein